MPLRSLSLVEGLSCGEDFALVFGGTVSMVGNYYGYCTAEGAEGVGRATTESVVTNCLLILILDYILAVLLFPTY